MNTLLAGRTPAVKKNNTEGRKLFFMVVPFLVFNFMFGYVPLFGWVYAFFRYVPGIPLSKTPFAGFGNFAEMFADSGDIGRVMINTLVLSFFNLLTSPMPVILAIMLNEVRSRKFKKLIQTTTTLPHFIGWIIVFSLAFSMFSTDGAVNYFLSLAGITEPVNVLGNNDLVWFFHPLLNLWKNLGWNSIIYLAAIAGIDGELYDAAYVDGAGRFRRIWHITVPNVAPTFYVLLLLTVSGLLNAGSGLQQYLVFNNPMVAERIEVLDLYVYKYGLIKSDYSYATAVGIMKSFISILLLFTVNFTAKRTRGEGII